MDGLTFTQTERAPSGQGARNVLPMHELPVAIAACGLCTGCEVTLGRARSYVLRGLETHSGEPRTPDLLRGMRPRSAGTTWPGTTVRAVIS